MRTTFLGTRYRFAFKTFTIDEDMHNFKEIKPEDQLCVLWAAEHNQDFFPFALCYYLQQRYSRLVDDTCLLLLSLDDNRLDFNDKVVLDYVYFALRSGPSNVVFELVFMALATSALQLARLAQSQALMYLSRYFSPYACYVLLFYYGSDFNLLTERQMMSVVKHMAISQQWKQFVYSLSNHTCKALFNEFCQVCLQYGRARELMELGIIDRQAYDSTLQADFVGCCVER